MANFLDKFKITTATTKKHQKDLSCEHISSADFLQFCPAYYHNMIPGEKLTVDFRAFSRLAPMPVPTFGRAHMNMRAFFVPFRTIFKAWNDFITDAVHNWPNTLNSSIPSKVPTVSNRSLLNLLIGNSEQVTLSASYDFHYSESSNAKYIKLTTKGRLYYKILCSLGYAVNWSLNDTTNFNALPILALAKIYIDWYYPSGYVGDPDYMLIRKILEYEDVNAQIVDNDISVLFDFFNHVNYDSDYFVSAFDNPAGPNSGTSSNFKITDVSKSDYQGSTVINYQHNSTVGFPNDTPVIAGADPNGALSSNNPRNLSQYALDALKRLTSYLKRHQLAGSRALDRYLARFGVQLSSDKLNRCLYLGSHQIPLMTGDVMSTSQNYADENLLGSYAGKGFLVGKDGHFEFETDEYGLFFITYSIIPEVGYYQGIDRHNLHVTKLDFFTPEFDGMGTRAISSAELYLPTIDPDAANNYNWFNSVFGYTPQYSEYKCGRDFVSGDYRCRSLSQAGYTSDSWHLMREFESVEEPIVHSKDFSLGSGEQYNRIFYNASESADHFYLHFFFGVKSFAPLKPLYDDYDWENEEGQSRILDVNGVKMN